MKRKNTLKGWQMGILTALFVLMLITMFMPALHFNGDVWNDMWVKMADEFVNKKEEFIDALTTYFKEEYEEEYEYYGYDDDDLEEEVEDAVDEVFDEVDELTDADELSEDIDKSLDELKWEAGIDLTSFSPLSIMSHSLTGYITPDYDLVKDEDDEKDYDEWLKELNDLKKNKTYKKLNPYYNCIRAFLVINYLLALIGLIIVILSFVLKWSKKIPLIFSIVYSAFSFLLFAFLRFGLIHIVKGSLMQYTAYILDLDYRDISEELASILISCCLKAFTCLYSVAFVIAFLVALVLLVMSIICLVLGNRRPVPAYAGEDNYFASAAGGVISPMDGYMGGDLQFAPDNADNVFNTAGMDNGGPVFMNQNPVMSAPQNAPEPSPFVNPAPAMGKVRCVKGVAAGQGFQLPLGKKVIVGKNPEKTNLTVNDPNVSNVHCSICYNPERNTYIVKDHSTNGTFVNGSRLPKEVDVEYPAGTVLVLADGANEILLG